MSEFLFCAFVVGLVLLTINIVALWLILRVDRLRKPLQSFLQMPAMRYAVVALVIGEFIMGVQLYCLFNAKVPERTSGGIGRITATAKIWPKGTPTEEFPMGIVSFEQMDDIVRISGRIYNVMPGDQLHGFHIHSVEDYSKGCDSTGGHYNPTNKTHGDITADESQHRHVGDLGNLLATTGGTVTVEITDTVIKLGDKYGIYNVVGRPIVIHQGVDDLGKGGDANSLLNGNSGPRIGCGTIELD